MRILLLIVLFTGTGSVTTDAQPLFDTFGPYDTPGYVSGFIGGPRIAAADFDEDGHLDLAVLAPIDDVVRILLGDGFGSFSLIASPAIGAAPTSLAIGDLDEDGHLDIVTSSPGSFSVSILRGDGLGGFAAQIPLGFSAPLAVELADVNDDGHLDLLVTQNGVMGPGTDGFVTIHSGQGNGEFGLQSVVIVGVGPGALRLGDFDEDGNADLLVGCFGFVPLSGGGLYLLPGDGSINFPSIGNPTAFGEYASLAVDDLNGDGHLDVVGYQFTDVVCLDSYQVHYGDGLGGLSFGFGGSPDCGPMSFATGDLLGGPATDFVATNVGELWFFADGATIPAELSVGGQLGDVVTADFNGDGALDLAVGDSDVGGVFVLLRATGAQLQRGDVNDDGTIDIADAVAGLDYLFSHGTLACADALDVNDDGLLDIADPVRLLSALFGTTPVPPPSPDCGVDPTADPLGCSQSICG